MDKLMDKILNSIILLVLLLAMDAYLTWDIILRWKSLKALDTRVKVDENGDYIEPPRYRPVKWYTIIMDFLTVAIVLWSLIRWIF